MRRCGMRRLYGVSCQLFAEHLGRDTSEVDDGYAMQAFRDVAEANRCRLVMHDRSQEGLAIALDAQTYGR